MCTSSHSTDANNHHETRSIGDGLFHLRFLRHTRAGRCVRSGVRLKLYVSDPHDAEVHQMAMQVCHLIGAQLEVIDLTSDPEKADDDTVVVTPTLVIDGPPKRRVVGRIHNFSAAAMYLTLPDW